MVKKYSKRDGFRALNIRVSKELFEKISKMAEEQNRSWTNTTENLLYKAVGLRE